MARWKECGSYAAAQADIEKETGAICEGPFEVFISRI